jgi:hypothetical protein
MRLTSSVSPRRSVASACGSKTAHFELWEAQASTSVKGCVACNCHAPTTAISNTSSGTAELRSTSVSGGARLQVRHLPRKPEVSSTMVSCQRRDLYRRSSRQPTMTTAVPSATTPSNASATSADRVNSIRTRFSGRGWPAVR